MNLHDEREIDHDALIDGLRAGDAAAYEELIHRYSGKVYSIALSIVRDEQQARDVVQDTFLSVYQGIDGFRGDGRISAWLSRIARNYALMCLRTRRRKPEAPLLLAEETDGTPSRGVVVRDVIDFSPLADRVAENRELAAQIRAAVDALPEHYRTVLVLADYQELSMKEIAEALELTVPNVKTRLHRARLAVREALADYLEGKR